MSNLEDLYREIILDHYRSPRNRGELAAPPAFFVEGFNPLCGDELKIYLSVEDGIVTDVKLSGHGCSISQASSSLMSVAVKGKSIDEVRALVSRFKNMLTLDEGTEAAPLTRDELRAFGEIAALQGVAKFPARIKCATLAWNTLTQALDENL
jgi:nitrogen fixation NifU-like protein